MKTGVIKLAEKDYAIGPFTLGQVSKIVPLITQSQGYKTPADAQASNTAIYTAISGTSFTGSYEEFLKISGVTFEELAHALLEIASTMGFLRAKDNVPGEAKEGESPSLP